MSHSTVSAKTPQNPPTGRMTGRQGICVGLLWSALLAASGSVWAAALDTTDVPGDTEIEPITNIERAAKTFLFRQAGGDQGAEVKVVINRVDPRLRLKRCDQDLEASLAPGARRDGNTSVRIGCRQPVPWSLFVTATVERIGKVVVVKRPISRGSVVVPADIALESRVTSRLLRGYFDDMTSVIGMQTERSLSPGDVLTDVHLKAPLWVERGQLVQVHSQAGGIRVSVSGEALDNGGAGERVRVRNSTSERVIEGLVESPGVVRIPL